MAYHTELYQLLNRYYNDERPGWDVAYEVMWAMRGRYSDVPLHLQEVVPAHGELNYRMVEIHEPPNEHHDGKKRTVKWSTYLSTLAKHGVDLGSDTDVQYFLVHCAGAFLPDLRNYEFELRSGMDITRTYYEGDETFHSCMTGPDARKTLLYSNNPDRVSLLVVLLNGAEKGRALVWQTNEGDTVLDRVYPTNNGAQMAAARHYAEQQGWITGVYSNDTADYSVTLDVLWRGAGVKWPHGLGSQPKRDSMVPFPYMDSFRYSVSMLNGEPMTFRTSQSEYFSQYGYSYLTFCETGGGYGGTSPFCACDFCGDVISTRSAQIYNNLSGDGYRHYACSNCTTEHLAQVSYTYFLKTDVVTTVSGSTILRTDAYQLYDGRFEHASYSVQLWDGSYASRFDSELTSLTSGLGRTIYFIPRLIRNPHSYEQAHPHDVILVDGTPIHRDDPRLIRVEGEYQFVDAYTHTADIDALCYSVWGVSNTTDTRPAWMTGDGTWATANEYMVGTEPSVVAEYDQYVMESEADAWQDDHDGDDFDSYFDSEY